MSLNQEFNIFLREYLFSVEFKNSEFKDIFKEFSKQYPHLEWDGSYHKLYRVVRNLADEKLIHIAKSKKTFRYTTNYTFLDLENMNLEIPKEIKIKEKLKSEAEMLNISIKNKELEINFLDMYIKEYPILDSTIKKFKTKYEQQLCYLESKSSVLEKIRMAI